MESEKKIYVRPEDICELIIDKIMIWKDPEIIKNNVSKILWYLKNRKFEKLSEEFKIENIENLN